MTLARTTARGALLTLFVFLLTAGAAAASTSGKVPPLVFPVLGAASYIDDFARIMPVQWRSASPFHPTAPMQR